MQQRRRLFPLAFTPLPLALAAALACSNQAAPTKGKATFAGSPVMKDEAVAVDAIAPAAAPAPPAPSMAAAVDTASGASAMPAAGSMLIRTANVSVEVRSLDSAVTAARRVAQRYGAVVADANLSTGRNEVHRGVLRLRVPAPAFDSLLGGLTPLGRVESVAVNAQDIGEEYVDVQARLANLRRLETRIVELLATRTGKLTDVLTAERELARIRGEIEQAEGRRRYLSTAVALSTVELTLHEPEAILAGTPGSNPMAVALREAWRNFVASAAWCIAMLGVVIPVGVLALGAWLVARWTKARVSRA